MVAFGLVAAVLFGFSVWISSLPRWSGWRRVAAVYGAGTVFAGGLTFLGWLGDCAPHQIDGQCGMSTVFSALVGLVGAFILVAVGHLLPALRAPIPRPSSRQRLVDEQAEEAPGDRPRGRGAI